MALNEVLNTGGDIRRFLANTMVQVRDGSIPVDKGEAIAKLAKSITDSLQSEINVLKIKKQYMDANLNAGEITKIGRMVIDDSGSTPMLSGRSDE